MWPNGRKDGGLPEAKEDIPVFKKICFEGLASRVVKHEKPVKPLTFLQYRQYSALQASSFFRLMKIFRQEVMDHFGVSGRICFVVGIFVLAHFDWKICLQLS